MFKQFLSILCPTIVLMSALTACQRKEKELDIYEPEAPKIIRSEGSTFDYVSWNKGADRALDLYDAFDVSHSGAAKLTVISRCTSDINSSSEVAIKNPQVVRLFQVLPQELLTTDISRFPASCSFDFRLSNSIGSARVFLINDTPIQDKGIARVEIDADKVVRYQTNSPVLAQVICKDVTLPSMQFHQALEFKYFDFSRPTPRARFAADVLEERPMQMCRIAALKDGLILDIGHTFSNLFPRTSLKLERLEHGPIDILPELFPTQDLNPFLFQRTPFKLLVVSLENPTNVTRILELKSGNFPATYNLIGRLNAGHANEKFVVGTVQYSGISVKVTDTANDAKITSIDGVISIALRPSSKVTLTMEIQPPPNAKCNGVGNLEGMLISPSSPVMIDEISEQHDVVGQIELKLVDKIMLGSRGLTRLAADAAERVEASCAW